MVDAVKEVFGPGKPGFAITLLIALSVGEFLAEQLFRSSGRADRVPYLKAAGGIGAILILMTYIGMLLAKYVTWTTSGSFGSG
jgi:hypothetical protein